jgi:hypothetical protein
MKMTKTKLSQVPWNIGKALIGVSALEQKGVSTDQREDQATLQMKER